MGIAYSDRILGNRVDNLEQAIQHFALALEVFTRDDFPANWATTQNNLGTAHRNRILDSRADNLDQAIQHYSRALEVFSRNNFPEWWAMTQNNLAIAYSNRILGSRVDNLEQAIQHFTLALEVYTCNDFPERWAMIQNNLGTAYSDRIPGNRVDNLEQAIQHFTLALAVYTCNDFPVEYRRTQGNFGRAFLQQKDGQSAYVAFAEAISAAEMLFVGAGVPENQMHEVHENAALYDGIVTACIHLGSTQNEYARKALEYAEAGKARTFLDQMGQTDLPAPLDASTALMQEEQRLIDELRGITLAMLSSQGAQSAPEKQSDHPQDLQRTQALARSHRFHELRIELDTIWNRMLAEYPQANDYVTLRRGDAPAWNDLIELANEIDTQAAFVEFYSLEDEMVVFILHANCDQPKVLVLPLSREKLYYRYLLPYQQEVLNYAQHVNAGRRPTYSWLDLGTELLKPVQNYLEPEELVYFVPHGLLHVLPLHALLVDGAPFLQHHPIAYTPSLGVLTRVFQRQDHASAEFCPLVMGYAADDDAVKPYIETGTRNAAKVLGCTPLLGSQASRQALRDQAATATHLHLLCHGNFMPGTDALSSAVYLADGPFTAHDWMSVQTHADLVMLAACQTGMVDLNAGDELTGLVRSVLYAGASSVVATLWSVNADSTIRWTNEFYSHALANKQQPMSYAEAFRKATLSLYEQTDDPYFWAPFILVGDWR